MMMTRVHPMKPQMIKIPPKSKRNPPFPKRGEIKWLVVGKEPMSL